MSGIAYAFAASQAPGKTKPNTRQGIVRKNSATHLSACDRGLLVVVEGPDGAGKTTIVDSIVNANHLDANHLDASHLDASHLDASHLDANHLDANAWVRYKYPDRTTTIGKKINDILTGKLTVPKKVELKFFADNRQEDKQAIINALTQGKNVIVDRYVYSSIAYTMTNQFQQAINQLPVDDFMTYRDIVKMDKGMPKPDIVLLIHGNHLDERSEPTETKDGYDRNVLMANFMNAIAMSNTMAAIIDNTQKKDSMREGAQRNGSNRDATLQTVNLRIAQVLAAPRKKLAFF